jgi:hypothetical protein
MTRSQVVDGQIVYEVSEVEFRSGLLQVVDGDKREADRLFDEYKKVLKEEITQAKHAKSKNKTKHQIAYERLMRREKRRHYRKLRRNMKSKKPAYTAAHHVVPVFDRRGAIARKILRDFGIDLNDGDNGVFLPRYKTDVPHPNMKEAYAHSIIHTDFYYANVTSILQAEVAVSGTTKDDILEALKDIAQELKSGVFPIYAKANVK